MVHVTIRVGTLGYDVVLAICDTCQKTSYGSYIVSLKGILFWEFVVWLQLSILHSKNTKLGKSGDFKSL